MMTDFFVPVKDKYGYLTTHKNMVGAKSDVCEMIFSNCEAELYKYTIIIPEYRRPHTVKQAILSAVNQNYGEAYEVLITSDGISPEELETEQIVGEIARYHKNISYYRNTTNVGMFDNWNNSIYKAKGKWIVVLPDDDMLSPFFLSAIDSYVDSVDYSGMVGVLPHKIYGKIEYNPQDFEKPDGRIKGEKLNLQDVFWGGGVSVTGMTFEKEKIIELGGFQSVFYPVSDSVCYVNFAYFSNLVRLNCDIAAYRVDNNVSQQNGIMTEILTYGVQMMETLALNDSFLMGFYKLYKKELAFDYIKGAEKTWNIKIKETDVDGMVKQGFHCSMLKLYFMKFHRKFLKYILKIRHMLEHDVVVFELEKGI